MELREVEEDLDPRVAALCAYARGLLLWHGSANFGGKTGAPLAAA